MIGYLEGTVIDTDAENVLVQTNNVGFNVRVTKDCVYDCCRVGEVVKLFTYMSVREDDISLYGFITKEELNFYKMLITVNGIGPKAAMTILSSGDVITIQGWIYEGDSKALSGLPGIGKKTAERIILDLKDKVGAFVLENDISSTVNALQTGESDSNKEEAILALVALGYHQKEASNAVAKVENYTDVNDILKAALKFF